MSEPILDPSAKRDTALPVDPRYKDIFDMYDAAEQSFWRMQEIKMHDDTRDWLALSENERHFLKWILAFFATADGIVAANVSENFAKDVTIKEAQLFYDFQVVMENIHAMTYSMLLEFYVPHVAAVYVPKEQSDEVLTAAPDAHDMHKYTVMSERDFLNNAIRTIPVVKQKAEWARKWMNRETRSFAERCVAFVAIEGIFFSGSFCAIFWFKARGKLPGLCQSNDLISRDEAMHCQFGCLLYSKLVHKLTAKRVYEIIQDAVQHEQEFVTDALPVSLIGMNPTLMRQYIEFVADFWIVQLGYQPLYNVPNPFDFMNLISVSSKKNFFEHEETNYRKAGCDVHTARFALDEDF